MTTAKEERADRLAVHQNDERVRRGGTYHDIAASEAGALGGRYGAVSKTGVIGSGPTYPRLPASSPWAERDPVPDEPPIDIDVSAMPIVGEPHEVAASLARSQSGEGIDPPAASPPSASPDGGAGSGVPQPKGAVETAPPASRRRKR